MRAFYTVTVAFMLLITVVACTSAPKTDDTAGMESELSQPTPEPEVDSSDFATNDTPTPAPEETPTQTSTEEAPIKHVASLGASSSGLGR